MKPNNSYIDQDTAKVLLEKWEPVVGFSSDKVKPLENYHDRLNTAILLENQEEWCIREANQAGTGGVFGTHQGGGQGGAITPASDFYAQGDARLPKILIPMIRRTFPELITNEIVGVQPMSGPVGLAFALRYRYEQEALGYSNGLRDGSVTTEHVHGSDAYSQTSETLSGAIAGNSSEELGYNFLDTRFTGTSSGELSGLGSGSDFDFVPQDQGVAELLQNFELTGKIPQITLSFEKTAVEAGTRRLAARWSIELEQDLKNMNGIDIDTEMTNTMSYEIQAEIDREMIVRMIQVALNAGNGSGYSTWTPISADGRWLAERNRDLYAKIIVEANRVAIRNRRGAANFIVATPRVCAILEMLPEFQWMQVQGNVNTQPVGIAKVGTLGGRFSVYRDTRTEAQYYGNGAKGSPAGFGARYHGNSRVEYALLGYKGPEFFDTGLIYCPYIPIMVQRTMGPNDFSPRVGLMTRYGVVDNIFGADLYYHVIIIKNLGDSFDPAIANVYFG